MLHQIPKVNRIAFSLSFKCNVRCIASVTGRVFLPSTSFIEIRGSDTKKFLQGLCTNDVSKMVEFGECLPACFLNTKGRIVATSLFYNNQRSNESIPSTLIEVDASQKNELHKYLNLYKLRSKISINSFAAKCNFTTAVLSENERLELQNQPGVIMVVTDPRSADFGSRILMQTETPDFQSCRTKAENNKSAIENYKQYSLVHAILDGPEIVNRIPLECNLDLQYYISFSKGCYIGQELIARTKFKGVVRKRLLPFSVTCNNNSDIKYETQQVVTAFKPGTQLYPCQNEQQQQRDEHSVSSDYNKGDATAPLAGTGDVKSIGEVVSIDDTLNDCYRSSNSTSIHGVAMVQLAALPIEGSDNVNSPYEHSSTIHTVNRSISLQNEADIAIDLATELGNISYNCSVYQPSWFRGQIDKRTGNMIS